MPFLNDRTSKQENKGKFIEYQGSSGATKINAVKWHDNIEVHMASTYMGGAKPALAKRWCFNENKESQIDCPAFVTEYNYFMGQIDNIYRIKMESRKRSYLKILERKIS